MAIHLHETTAIDRGGKEAYLRLVARGFAPYAEASLGLRLVWIASTIGSTGAWPETQALWELRDWDHWAELCASSDADRERLRFRTEAAKLCLRTTRRTLVDAAFSPSLDDLLRERAAAPALAVLDLRCKPGRAGEVLAAVERRVALDGERGRRLVGAYEVAFTNDAVVAIGAHADLAGLAAFEERRGTDAAYAEWERAIAPLVVAWSEHWAFVAAGPLAAPGRVW